MREKVRYILFCVIRQIGYTRTPDVVGPIPDLDPSRLSHQVRYANIFTESEKNVYIKLEKKTLIVSFIMH